VTLLPKKQANVHDHTLEDLYVFSQAGEQPSPKDHYAHNYQNSITKSFFANTYQGNSEELNWLSDIFASSAGFHDIIKNCEDTKSIEKDILSFEDFKFKTKIS